MVGLLGLFGHVVTIHENSSLQLTQSYQSIAPSCSISSVWVDPHTGHGGLFNFKTFLATDFFIHFHLLLLLLCLWMLINIAVIVVIVICGMQNGNISQKLKRIVDVGSVCAMPLTVCIRR